MKISLRTMLLVLVTTGLSGCLDPVAPRLPGPGDEDPNDTSTNGKAGFVAPDSATSLIG